LAARRRTDLLKRHGTGMAWASVFNVRGKNRKIEADLIDYEPCDG